MFKRRRVKQVHTLKQRLREAAKHLREAAARLPPGTDRERLLRKARLDETTSHISEWLSSPGLRPPR